MTFIEKQVTNMREPVEVERQVAATLYYLSISKDSVRAAIDYDRDFQPSTVTNR